MSKLDKLVSDIEKIERKLDMAISSLLRVELTDEMGGDLYAPRMEGYGRPVLLEESSAELEAVGRNNLEFYGQQVDQEGKVKVTVKDLRARWMACLMDQ